MIVKTERNLMSNLKNNKKLKNRIKPKGSKKKFECRIITNPVELMKMGYNPSVKLIPINDYETNELTKKVG